MKTITLENFDETVKSHPIVLVDFWATWCPPCRALLPVLESLEKEMGNRVLICKINVEEQPELADRMSVSGIPAMFFFKNGNPIKKIVGLTKKEALVKEIETLEK